MTDRIYCEDCRHFRQNVNLNLETVFLLGRCAHPQSLTGSSRYVARSLDVGGYADMTRGADYLCGPLAAWFEPLEVSNAPQD